MKVILKAGERNEEIRQFFLDKILPVLDFGIAFETTDRIIIVYEKTDNGLKEYVDPTVEVIVELSFDIISFLRDNVKDRSKSFTRAFISGNPNSERFLDEAMAIRKLEKLNPDFSIEYYSCRYTPAKK